MDKEALDGFFTHNQEKEFDVMVEIEWKNENHDVIMEYVKKLCNIPVEEYLEYIDSCCEKEAIDAKDVFQFSSFDDATKNLCNKMSMQKKGISFQQVGEILQDDGVQRKPGALMKYGENHAKMGEALGFISIKDRRCYLTGLGRVAVDVSNSEWDKLITRLILRTKLITRMYKESRVNNVDLECLLYDLSESTYRRRKSNVRGIMNIIKDSQEYNFDEFYEKIIY